MEILSSIGAAIASAGLLLASFFGYTPPTAPTLGANLPAATAVFETSLAAPISSSATSMTLASNEIRGGGSLSGYNCFTVDEGSAQAETICGTVSGTTVSSLSRGISQATGTTTVAALQFSHRRGASVKITDFPLIQILKAQNNGEETFENALIYASGVGTTSADFPSAYSIVNRGYVDAVALNAGSAIGATESAAGYIEIATAAEAAASTQNGTAGRLVLPASLATSTYNSATAANRVVVTDGSGFIDPDFIPTLATTSFSGAITLTGTATSTIASSTLRAYTASTTPSDTWTKPANLKYVLVKVVGAGGGGQGGQNAGTDDVAGAGGGGGGYCEKIIPAAALASTVSVVVPTGGTGGTGSAAGTQNPVSASFGSHCTASNGAGGNVAGGDGGSGSNGDMNLTGDDGVSAGTIDISGGSGGSSMLGGGGRGGSGANAGANGNNYGGGGGGGSGASLSGDVSGGNGAGGAVFVYEYYF